MLASCAQQSIQTMTAAEKAVLTTRLRKESNECFERFRRSDFQDVEALECFADRMGQTTEIHLSPAACPSCYLEYGRGLHLLGVYWWERRKDLEQRLLRASAGDEARIRADFEAADRKVKDYFRRALETLEAYFATRDSIIPQAYDWASQEAAEIGDFRRAIRYLKQLETSSQLSERDRLEISKRVQSYRSQHEKQERDKLRARLE